MGVTQTEAGVILSLVFTSCIVIIIVIGSKGKSLEYTTPIGSLLGLVFFTYIGWLPLWTGSALALVVAIFLGKVISGW
jgi:exosortase/archaeosortase